MREILFRGKNDRGAWIEGFYIKDYIGTYIYDKYRNTRMQSVLPETAGQYTGLTDKYGKKIFEGDIICNHNGAIGKVQWYEEHCAFMIYSITENKVYWLFDNNFSLVEVIGNIHDNPELLKGE